MPGVSRKSPTKRPVRQRPAVVGDVDGAPLAGAAHQVDERGGRPRGAGAVGVVEPVDAPAVQQQLHQVAEARELEALAAEPHQPSTAARPAATIAVWTRNGEHDT